MLTDEPNIDAPFFANEAGGAVDGSRLPDGALVFLMTDGRRAGLKRRVVTTEPRRRCLFQSGGGTYLFEGYKASMIFVPQPQTRTFQATP